MSLDRLTLEKVPEQRLEKSPFPPPLNPFAHEPGALIGDPELARDLHRRGFSPNIRAREDCCPPILKREVGAVQERHLSSIRLLFLGEPAGNLKMSAELHRGQRGPAGHRAFSKTA